MNALELDEYGRRVLIKASNLVSRGWTQGGWASDAKGRTVSPGNPDATRWCAAGAIARASYEIVPCDASDVHKEGTREVQQRALSRLGKVVSETTGKDVSVARWNDHVAKSGTEVAEAMSKAAAL